MRAVDQQEIYACRPHDSPLQLAIESYSTIRNMGRGKIGWYQGRPAGVFAFTENWPGNWDVWMYGTDDFKAAAIPLLRWCRKEAHDILEHTTATRLQCASHIEHTEAHAMIKAMGAVQEGPPMRRYGKDGADFIKFVWIKGVNSDVINPGFVRPNAA